MRKADWKHASPFPRKYRNELCRHPMQFPKIHNFSIKTASILDIALFDVFRKHGSIGTRSHRIVFNLIDGNPHKQKHNLAIAVRTTAIITFCSTTTPES